MSTVPGRSSELTETAEMSRRCHSSFCQNPEFAAICANAVKVNVAFLYFFSSGRCELSELFVAASGSKGWIKGRRASGDDQDGGDGGDGGDGVNNE